MDNIEFTDENRQLTFSRPRMTASNSKILLMTVKWGLVRNIDQAYYLIFGLTWLFFVLAILIVAVSV